MLYHGDVIKWKHFPRYWPFVRGIPLSQVNSPHKDQWRGALMFSLIRSWINTRVNNREADYLGRHLAHYDVIVMIRVSEILFNSRITLLVCIWEMVKHYSTAPPLSWQVYGSWWNIIQQPFNSLGRYISVGETLFNSRSTPLAGI